MKAKKFLYWFDNNTESAVINEVSAGLVHLDADISALQPGFHILNFAVLGEDNAVTSVRFSSFVKAVGLSVENLNIVYSFDQKASAVSKTIPMGDGLYGFSLDVSALEDGEHTISYMLTDGKYSLYTGEAQFVKTEMSGIDVILSSTNSDGKAYNLNGIRIKPTGKNIYIVNGKKVMLK